MRQPPAKPARKRRTKAADAEARERRAEAPPNRDGRSTGARRNNDTTADDDGGEPRRGWWQRTFG